jgi:hypothetical protein
VKELGKICGRKSRPNLEGWLSQTQKHTGIIALPVWKECWGHTYNGKVIHPEEQYEKKLFEPQIFFNYLFWGLEFELRASQALYYLSHTSSSFCSG